MAKIDLKDVYFLVPVHRDHQRWLRFHWQDQNYQFCCLPFGLYSASHMYKDHMPNSGLAETTGSEIYCLNRQPPPFSSLQGGSPHTSSTHNHCIISIGFSINNKKSILIPCQKIEFLGVMVHSHPPALRLPQYKLQTLKSKVQQLLCKDALHQTITARDLA